jgi:galactonate dehydratase
MHIRDLRVFHTEGVHSNWVLLKIYTDSGLTGVGEASMERHDAAIVTELESMKEFLVGKDPFQIEYIWNSLYKQTFWYGQVVTLCALSGVEQALWDIKGKALGVPVYELLGGKLRDRVRAYANSWAFKKSLVEITAQDTPESIAVNAHDTVQQGFSALKWDPFRNGGQVLSREEADFAVASVKAVRETVGPKVDLLIECHGRFNVHSAIQMAQRLEPYDPFFYEEPIPPDNIDAMAAVQAAIRLPVATGERLYTRWDFRPLFEKQAARILQPDVAHVGGILELRKIAAMAETYYIPVQPHSSYGPVSLLASLQIDACIPNFIIQEFQYADLELYNQILTQPIRFQNGYLEIPAAPGLGADIREDVLKRRPPVKLPVEATWIGSYW